ncbi:hypothetical protein Tco_0276288 [Tanacetum coccineum]
MSSSFMESIALIMRNKPDIDEIDIYDLYNNLRVYEDKVKSSSSSTTYLSELGNSSSKTLNDEESIPANDRSSKADGYHAVPPPITGNFLTPRADISFAGKTNEANTQKPKTVYESVNRDKVIIEDWNSDDEDDVSEVQTINR